MTSKNPLDWKHLFNSIKDSVIILDTNGIIEDCNKAFLKLVNKPKNLVIGSDCSKIIFGRTNKLKNCPYLRSKRSKKRESLTVEKDNKWLIVDVDPIFDENQISGFVLFISDITEHKKADEVTQESEEKFRTLTENINVGIYRNTVGKKGKFIEANPAIVKMFGFKNREEFLAHNVSELYLHPEERKEFNDEMLERGFVKDKVLQLKQKDGAPFFGSISAVTIKDNDGNLQFYDGIIEDITKRKKAENALWESEKKYKDLFEKSKDAILIIHNGKFVDCNQATIKMLRYNNKDEFLNTHPSKLSPEKQPDGKMSFTKANEMMKIALKNGSHRFEWDHEKSDGEIFPVEVLLTTISSDEENKILHTVWRDITERKKVELALQKSEERFKQLVENAKDIIYRLDANGYITYVNPVTLKMGNYTKKDLIGKKYLGIVHPDYYRETKRFFRNQFIKKIKNTYKEIPVRTKSGSYVWLGQNVQLLFEKDKIVGFQAVARDITKRREAEEALRNGRERLKLLNQIIRHDLANDFIVIKSAVNIFRRSSEIMMIDEIERRADKSLATIDTYRKYESFINSNVDLNKIETSELINEIIIEYPKINFNINGKCNIFADDALDSVFTNLISNSIKHGNSTKIDIKISSKKNICEIKFMDNGTGIPDKIKNKIFNEGFIYGKAGHTGIGLHIVKKTIERYGGTISVEDNSPNGTVFIIRLRQAL